MSRHPDLVAALRTNAVCSLVTGSVLVIAPASAGEWLGVSLDGWLRLIGVGLVAHALGLSWASGRRDIGRWAKVNLALIVPYPLLLLGLVAVGRLDRSEGVVILLLDALLVTSLAVWQWSAAGSMRRTDIAAPA